MKKPLIIHHLLFAVFPVLFLFSHNIKELSIDVIFIPISILGVFTLLSWFVLSSVVRSKMKVGLLISFFLLLFFSYGHIYNLTRSFTIWGFEVWRHRYLFLIWLAFLMMGVYSILKTRLRFHNLTNFLNIMACLLAVISVINILIYRFNTKGLLCCMKNKAKIESQQITKSTISNLPDIYYIILDGYTSGSILKEIYNYDNIGFYDYLTKKGFYVSEKSMSNYSTTYLSLWSSLNFSYINELDDGVPLDRIGDNKVFRFLRQHGYDVVAFSSTGDMEIEDVDLHIKPKWSIDGFSNQLLNTTPLFILLTKITREGIWYSLYRNNILDAFENLIDKAEFKNPTFVFVHIAAPHPPFVFDEKGGALSHDRMFSCNDGSDFMREGGTTEEYVEGYRKQVIFISKKIEGVIDRIISDSVEKPIIILQGDHGSRSMYDRFSADRTYFRECFSILNAYYFPDSDYVRLYDKVTPVNTFRIIFNQYFETDHELLEDRSYFLPSGQRDRPIEVTDEL